MLLVPGRVHHDARAVDDELGGSLRSDLVGRKSGAAAPEVTIRALAMSTLPSAVAGCLMSSSQIQKPSSFTCKAAQSKQAGPEGTAGLSGPAFALAPHAFALTYMIV